MMISRHEWNMIRTQIFATSEQLPCWLRTLNFDECEHVGDTPFTFFQGGVRIHIELSMVTLSFLQFLHEQISLEPRGPEWTKILKSRMEKLSNYLDTSLISITFSTSDEVISTYLSQKENELRLAHLELHLASDGKKTEKGISRYK